jgi:hypothetical protein
MRIQMPFVLLFAIVFACSMHTVPAQAQRVFVSATGSDGNPCSFASPCRSFQHAHDTVAANGEIDVLDPAGYGPLTITKAISIQGHGFSGISVPNGGIGITVNAGSTDKVSLSGLMLDGTTIGHSGITFNTGQSLTVEDCVVRNMATSGLIFISNAATLQTLAVSNSYFNDNGGDGILIESGSGSITASIDRTGLHGNIAAGLAVQGAFGTGTLSVAVKDSVADNNASTGFSVTSLSGASVSNLSLTHVQAAGNVVGIEASGTNAAIWLTQSTVAENSNAGFKALTGGVINSYTDNSLQSANGPNNTGTLTTVLKQ